MINVTQSPSGTAHATAGTQASGGIVIAGKTGTAQNGINNSGLDDAVFTCFAPATNPQIAVGVIVKGGGFGADASAPIAVAIIKAYLQLPGEGMSPVTRHAPGSGPTGSPARRGGSGSGHRTA